MWTQLPVASPVLLRLRALMHVERVQNALVKIKSRIPCFQYFTQLVFLGTCLLSKDLSVADIHEYVESGKMQLQMFLAVNFVISTVTVIELLLYLNSAIKCFTVSVSSVYHIFCWSALKLD